MKLLKIEDSVQLSKIEAIIIIPEVTRMWEKTTVMHDYIFTLAPEDSSRV